MREEKISQICKALGDPNRLRIVRMLTHGEMCGCRILEQFAITQPTLSHHMKVLGECGLVKDRKEGRWHYYSLNCDVFIRFRDFIGSLTCICEGDRPSHSSAEKCCGYPEQKKEGK